MVRPDQHRTIDPAEIDVDRFFAKTMPEPNSGCLLWVGSVDEHGYGRFAVRGNNRHANRVAWTIANGPIPQGFVILHKCDNPGCVEATHLEAGTYSDNAVDMYRKGRDNKRRLTEAQVRRARELRATTSLTYRDIAEMFGDVSTSTVRLAVLGETWSHV